MGEDGKHGFDPFVPRGRLSGVGRGLERRRIGIALSGLGIGLLLTVVFSLTAPGLSGLGTAPGVGWTVVKVWGAGPARLQADSATQNAHAASRHCLCRPFHQRSGTRR